MKGLSNVALIYDLEDERVLHAWEIVQILSIKSVFPNIMIIILFIVYSRGCTDF